MQAVTCASPEHKLVLYRRYLVDGVDNHGKGIVGDGVPLVTFT